MVAKVGVVAASRAAGVSRATVNRYIKSGKLSATRDRKGKLAIDTAELTRVFGELQPMQPDVQPSKRRRQQPRDTSFATDQQVAFLEREVARLEAECERLRRELAEEKNERRELQSVVNRRTLPGPGILDRIAALFR